MTKQFLSVALHISHTETVYTFCRQKLYKMYTLMYTKCIEDVYHISTNFCKYFLYNIKRTTTATEFCIQNVYKLCQNARYIFHTNILYTFCTCHFWSTKSAHHKNYMYNLYTKFMQNIYANNIMQNGYPISHILTCLLGTPS